MSFNTPRGTLVLGTMIVGLLAVSVQTSGILTGEQGWKRMLSGTYQGIVRPQGPSSPPSEYTSGPPSEYTSGIVRPTAYHGGPNNPAIKRPQGDVNDFIRNALGKT